MALPAHSGPQMLAMEGGQGSTLPTHMQAHITVGTNLTAAQSMAVSTSATTGHGLPSPGQASTSGQGEAAQLRATMPAADDSLSECSLLTDITSDTTSVLSLSPHSPKEATQAAASPGRHLLRCLLCHLPDHAPTVAWLLLHLVLHAGECAVYAGDTNQLCSRKT